MATIKHTGGALFQSGAERFLAAALLLFAAAATIAPYLWMLSASFKTGQEMYVFPPTWLPAAPNLGNYIEVLQLPYAGQQLVNSLIYAGGTTLANLILCSLAGYAFARLEFRGRNALFALVLALLMVPTQSQIIPVFLIVKHIPFAGGNDWLGNGGTGLLNTYAGLILPNAATPFGIFLMRQFFIRVPPEYEESARLDGAGSFAIFRKILLPLSRPALTVLAILSFQQAWNDFVWPLILTSTRDMGTLQTGLQLLHSGPDTRWNVVMAAAALITAPMIIVFLSAQRHFIQNFASTGLKG